MKIIDCDVHYLGPTKGEWLLHLEEPYQTEFEFHNGPRRDGPGIRAEDGGKRWDVSITKPLNYVN